MDKPGRTQFHNSGHVVVDGAEFGSGHLVDDDQLYSHRGCSFLVTSSARYATIAAQPGDRILVIVLDPLADDARLDRSLQRSDSTLYG